ncbi:MAG: hypothetical protein ACJA1A_000173 [Saprospiraceae bacterium]|jgi:hypothetical protein
MLSQKYYDQLLQDIKKAHNPNPPSDLDQLFALEDVQEEDQIYFEAENKPLTEIDELETEMSDEDEEAEDEEAEQQLIDHLEDVEAFLEFDHENNDTFGNTIGLDSSMFPKAELFTDNQLYEIVLEFNNMLRTHRVSADIPLALDSSLKYNLLISILDETLFLSHSGINSWDWCTEESITCPYGEHCTCIEIERDFENKISDAKTALRALRTEVRSFMTDGKLFTYEVDHTLIGSFDNMSMYISHGIPDIPFSVSLFKNRWKDTISNLQKYLYRYPHIAALFDVDDPIGGHKVLENFLSLSTSCPWRSHFKIEPFYIEDGQIIKGYKTPDVDLPIDDFDRPKGDPLDDVNLPF